MIELASKTQIGAIHALKKAARLDDDTYRDLLERVTGRRSAADLTRGLAIRAIDALKDAAGQGHGAVAGLNTPLGGKLRALWIAGYNLGLVRDRTDRAMLSFVERQTGVSHLRFFTDPQQGTQAVEGLKGWLARDGGVGWTTEKDDSDALASRRAVLDAQWAKLVALDQVAESGFFDFAYKVTRKHHLALLTAEDLDAVQAALGRRLRAAIEAKPRATEDAA